MRRPPTCQSGEQELCPESPFRHASTSLGLGLRGFEAEPAEVFVVSTHKPAAAGAIAESNPRPVGRGEPNDIAARIHWTGIQRPCAGLAGGWHEIRWPVNPRWRIDRRAVRRAGGLDGQAQGPEVLVAYAVGAVDCHALREGRAISGGLDRAGPD